MKLLVNDKELARYLISLLDLYEICSNIELNQTNIADAVMQIAFKKISHKFDAVKHKDKIHQKIRKAVTKDLSNYKHKIEQQIQYYHNHHFDKIHKNIEYFLEKLGEEKVIDHYIASRSRYFIKTVGLQLSADSCMIRRKHFFDPTEDCLLRNTVGNENLLVEKIDRHLPFWFIDSGYTNFIEPNKKWHRLVRNHLHFNEKFSAPADRLTNFSIFPKPWKKEGKKILIVEPGPFAASIFHVDTKKWSSEVIEELRKHTDRPIEIRQKINKKTRESLYKTVSDGDYYCTISINSNSAVESIWAGVPAITLDKHISNSVTRSSLSQINDLYRGSLGDWLTYLSYCQFTFEELMDGTALDIVRRYHNV